MEHIDPVDPRNAPLGYFADGRGGGGDRDRSGDDDRDSGRGDSAGETGGRAAHVSPRRADEQDAPEPERPLDTAEEAGESVAELDEPPLAEGSR